MTTGRRKETCTTMLVLEALRAQDDFMDYDMLIAATRRARNQVNAACHHLRKFRAADVVINPDGKAWWFATPPIDDRRSFIQEERTPESKPRRPRKRRENRG